MAVIDVYGKLLIRDSTGSPAIFDVGDLPQLVKVVYRAAQKGYTPGVYK